MLVSSKAASIRREAFIRTKGLEKRHGLPHCTSKGTDVRELEAK